MKRIGKMKARGGGRRGREGQAVGGEASFEGWPVSDEFTAGGDGWKWWGSKRIG